MRKISLLIAAVLAGTLLSRSIVAQPVDVPLTLGIPSQVIYPSYPGTLLTLDLTNVGPNQVLVFQPMNVVCVDDWTLLFTDDGGYLFVLYPNDAYGPASSTYGLSPVTLPAVAGHYEITETAIGGWWNLGIDYDHNAPDILWRGLSEDDGTSCYHYQVMVTLVPGTTVINPPNPPLISAQPQSLSVFETWPAVFSVTAGPGTLAYQWFKNGVPISGANSSTYTISSVGPADAGNYTVQCNNADGAVLSDVATLTILPVFYVEDDPGDIEFDDGWIVYGYSTDLSVPLSALAIPSSLIWPPTQIAYPVTAVAGGHWPTQMTGVSIPDSVSHVFGIPFAGCPILTSILVDVQNAYYSSVQGVLFDKNQMTLLEYPKGLAGSYTIPSTVAGIEDSAFSGCSKLTSAIIPTSVTSIGHQAFYNCTRLNSIIIPNSVTNLGSYAFSGCSSLSGLLIGDSVTNIADSTFYGCSSLTSLLIPNNITDIGQQAFYGCSSLTSVLIPNSVTSIGDDAFYQCSGLTSLTIGDNVTQIGEQAFYDCSSLTNLAIGNGVNVLGYAAFAGCSSLTNVTFGTALTVIGYSAFGSCTSLTSLTIPNNVTTIGQHAFDSCTGLANVTIGSGVASIGPYAFQACSSLTSIVFLGNAPVADSTIIALDNVSIYYLSGSTGWAPNIAGPSGRLIAYEVNSNSVAITGCIGTPITITIPSTIAGLPVTSVQSEAFVAYPTLTAFTVDPQNASYSSLNGVLFDKSQTTLVAFPAGLGGSYVIPGTVTNISGGAFAQCLNLTNVFIPASVTTIGERAFDGCTTLTAITVDPQSQNYSSLNGVLFDKGQATLVTYPAGVTGNYTLPGSVTNIGYLAFSDGSRVTGVTIPNSVNSISEQAFAGCAALTNVTAGSGLSNLGAMAFSNCPSLVTVYFLGNAPSADTTVFAGDPGTVYYLFGTSGWSLMFAGLPAFLLPYNYSSSDIAITVTNYTGSGGTAIIPGSINGLPVTGIGANAFQDSSILTAFVIPNTITSIGARAFQGCTNLTSVFFVGNEPSVDATVFGNDPNLTVYNLLTGAVLTYTVLNISSSPSGGLNLATVANWSEGPLPGPMISVADSGAVATSGKAGGCTMTVATGGTVNWAGGTITGSLSQDVGSTVNASGGLLLGPWTIASNAVANCISGTTYLASALTNYGTLVVTNGAAVSGALGATTSGALVVADGARLEFGGGVISAWIWVQSGGLLESVGTAYSKQVNGSITNAGTVRESGWGLLVVYGTTVNQAGGLWDIQDDSGVYWGSGSEVFYNAGTLRKSGGTGFSQMNPRLVNSGLVEVRSGTLEPNGGGQLDGVFNVAAGARLDLAGGPFTYSPPGNWTGAGEYRLVDGSLTLDRVIPNLELLGGALSLAPTFQGGAITNFTLSHATLTTGLPITGMLALEGNAVLNTTNTVTGTLVVTNGATVSGGLVVANGAQLEFGGGAISAWIWVQSGGLLESVGTAYSKQVNGAITNAGTVRESGWGLLVANSPIVNQAGGLWDIQDDSGVYWGTGSEVFYNAGTLRKSGGTGSSQINPLLVNSGVIEALSGTLDPNGPGFQMSAGVLRFGFSDTNQFGKLQVNNATALGGGIAAVFLNGFIPPTNTSFQVMSFPAHTGTFTNAGTPFTVGGGRDFIPTLSGTALTLVAAPTYFLQEPMITQQPTGARRLPGGSVELTVVSVGSLPTQYQWWRTGAVVSDGGRISGAALPTLSITNLDLSDAGNYWVVLTNNYGAVTSTIATLVVATNTLAPGLLAYFPFNGNAQDESGNGRDGVVQGAVLTTNRLGQGNQAYAFNGASQIQVNDLDPDLQTNGFSFGAWIRPDANTAVLSWDPDGGWGSTFIVSGPSLHFRVGTGSPSTDYGSAAPGLPLSQWSHVVVTHATARDRLYVNGQLSGEWPSQLMQGNVATLLLGGGYAGNFIGALDEVVVYGRELSGAEVSSLFAVGLTAAVAPQISLRSPLFVAGNLGFAVTGSAGTTVNFQRAPSLTGPWTSIGTALLGTNGLGVFQDTNPPAASGFYRVVQP